jgi:curved DNA-binding protein CbpA
LSAPLKNCYELLGIEPAASPDDVKRAFRQQIALYHPDKVHHLGKEFQEIAAERAAELTEAYRILSDAGRRAEYDRALASVPAVDARRTAPAPGPERAQSGDLGDAATTEAPASGAQPGPGGRVSHERATADQFVKRATLNRFREALASFNGSYDESDARGFDIACVPKAKLFARAKNPRLLGRFVTRVDADTVADAWTQATRWGANGDEVCVFLMGGGMAPPSELARAIAEQRRRTRASRVTLIPIDARNWDAHMPTDAPSIAKDLLSRLRRGS